MGCSTEDAEWKGPVRKGAGRGKSNRHLETEKNSNVAEGWRLSSEKLRMYGRQGARSNNLEDPMPRQDVRSRIVWDKLHIDLRHLSN